LVGVTAACTVGKSCVVLCTSGTAVEQWRQQFALWSTVAEGDVVVFTSATNAKEQPLSSVAGHAACVLLTTYSMLASERRSDVSERFVASIKGREWGLLVLDEVKGEKVMGRLALVLFMG
jgi:DNA excision repair protein ERCC-3